MSASFIYYVLPLLCTLLTMYVFELPQCHLASLVFCVRFVRSPLTVLSVCSIARAPVPLGNRLMPCCPFLSTSFVCIRSDVQQAFRYQLPPSSDKALPGVSGNERQDLAMGEMRKVRSVMTAVQVSAYLHSMKRWNLGITQRLQSFPTSFIYYSH